MIYQPINEVKKVVNWREGNLNYQIGYSEGYRAGVTYGAQSAQNQVFFYGLNSWLHWQKRDFRRKVRALFDRVRGYPDIPF